MCVICVKPKGAAMPTEEIFRNMWDSNRDGAGFMWADGKSVHIEKGFMTYKEFSRALDTLQQKLGDLTEKALVFHFRIGTAGGNIPANTHPFPLTDKISVMQKLRTTTNLGIAHNGIIHVTPRSKDISDTMEWIAAQLYPLSRMVKDWYLHPESSILIESATGSKFAFMLPDEQVYMVGNFTKDGDLFFSNSSYKWPTYSYYYSSSWSSSDNKLTVVDDPDDWPVYEHSQFKQVNPRDLYKGRLMLIPDHCYMEDLQENELYNVGEMRYSYALDNKGYVYMYDEIEDVAYMIVDDCIVYDRDGGEVKYDDAKSEYFQIHRFDMLDLATCEMDDDKLQELYDVDDNDFSAT